MDLSLQYLIQEYSIEKALDLQIKAQFTHLEVGLLLSPLPSCLAATQPSQPASSTHGLVSFLGGRMAPIWAYELEQDCKHSHQAIKRPTNNFLWAYLSSASASRTRVYKLQLGSGPFLGQGCIASQQWSTVSMCSLLHGIHLPTVVKQTCLVGSSPQGEQGDHKPLQWTGTAETGDK